MATTANYSWTTPALSGANNPPADLTSLASQIDATVKSLDALLTTAWTTYTPTWTDGTSNLSVGSGSITGRWKKAGRIGMAQVVLQRAADSNQGGGNWVFGLPFSTGYGFQFLMGSGTITGNGKNLPVTVMGVSVNSVGLIVPAGRVSNTVPGSWGAETVAFGVLCETTA